MKKTILAALISSTLFTGTAFANAAVVGAVASNPQVQSLAKEVMVDNFGDVAELLGDAGESRSAMKDLPVKRTFGNDQTKAQKKINKLYDEVFEIMTDNKVSHYQKQLERIKATKENLIAEKAELQAKIGLTFEEAEIVSIENDIVSIELQIESQDAKREEVLAEVHDRLNQYGSDIPFERVESMLNRVDSDDLIGMTTIFPVLAEFSKHLGNVASTSNDLVTSKKYYALYVSVLDIQMFIQKQYENRLSHRYIPQLNKMKEDTQKLINETSRMKSKAPTHMKAVYESNLQNQVMTRKVINLYTKVLQGNLNKTKKARSMVKQSYDLAQNTLDTVSISLDVSMLIKSNEGLFSAVMELSMPEMVTFQNSAMETEFNKLTAQLKAGNK